jgi:hypothetical protein
MTLPQVPAFPQHLQVEVVESLGVFLLSDDDVVWLGGELYGALVPLVDGHRQVEDIVEALEDRYPAAEVYYAVTQLAAR